MRFGKSASRPSTVHWISSYGLLIPSCRLTSTVTAIIYSAFVGFVIYHLDHICHKMGPVFGPTGWTRCRPRLNRTMIRSTSIVLIAVHCANVIMEFIQVERPKLLHRLQVQVLRGPVPRKKFCRTRTNFVQYIIVMEWNARVV